MMHYKLLLTIFIILSCVSITSADTVTLRPDGVGTHSDYTASPAVSNYLNVDEATNDGNSTYVYISVVQPGDYTFIGSYVYPPMDTYNMQNSANRLGEITSVSGYTGFAGYQTSIPGETTLSFHVGNNFIFNNIEWNYSTYSNTIPDLKVWQQNANLPFSYYGQYAVARQMITPITSNPNTNKKFTWDDVDDMEAGFTIGCMSGGAADNISGRVTQFYVVIDYDTTIPARPVTPSTTESNVTNNITFIWTEGSSNTDSYNISITNDTGTTWYTGVTNLFLNVSVNPNEVYSADIYSYNTANDALSSDYLEISESVLNNAPVTSALLTESQTNPTQIFTFTPTFDWTYFDAESDTQYSWEIQVGTSSGTSNLWASGPLVGTDTSDVYAGSALSRNINYVQVRTNDGYSDGAWELGTFQINALPVVTNVTITPGVPLESDDLTATNDTATDSNDDSISLYYRWYKDTVHQPALDNVSIVLADNTTADEVWKVGIIPNDGYENGTEVQSATVTVILGVPPVPINIANTSGYFWINWTFDEGTGDSEVDSYNISVTNKGWTNGSANLFHNATDLDANTAYTIVIYAYNNTYGLLSDSSLSDTMTVEYYDPPATPINISNTTGNHWIHWIFDEGTGIALIDSYNISVSGEGWTNGSSNLFHNATSLSPHTAYTIDIYAYNNTWGLNSTSLSDTMTVPNNIPILTDISSYYEQYENSGFSLDVNFTDLDGDSVTFTDNSSDWNINSTTGVVIWDNLNYTDVGVHNYRITIDDAFGGTVYKDFSIIILGNQNTVLNMIDASFESGIAGSNFTENEIPLSFSLTNIGSLDASITAKFTTSYGGIYGFINDTTVINGTNFKIGNTTLDVMSDDGNPVTLTDGVPKENTQINYGAQIKIPAAQDALEYEGVIELTFSTS